MGGLVGDKIALVPERVRKLGGRIKSWVKLRQTPKKDRKISIIVYGFPPNVGAVGTAALLDVPKTLEKLLLRLHEEGYDVGDFASSAASAGASASAANGESLVAALAVMCEEQVIAGGAKRMESTLQERLKKARAGDKTIPETLSNPNNNGGLGNNTHVRGFDISNEDLDKSLGKYMAKKVRKAWPVEKLQYHQAPPGVSSSGDLVVSGLQVGNVWISVQPLLGVEGELIIKSTTYSVWDVLYTNSITISSYVI